jgi:hypothetical protein
LREQAIPFAERVVQVHGDKRGDKVIFKHTDGAFGGIGAMFFGWNALERNIVFLKGIFEFLGTFIIVQDVKLSGMNMLE